MNITFKKSNLYHDDKDYFIFINGKKVGMVTYDEYSKRFPYSIDMFDKPIGSGYVFRTLNDVRKELKKNYQVKNEQKIMTKEKKILLSYLLKQYKTEKILTESIFTSMIDMAYSKTKLLELPYAKMERGKNQFDQKKIILDKNKNWYIFIKRNDIQYHLFYKDKQLYKNKNIDKVLNFYFL